MMLLQFWSRLLCLLFGIRVRTEGEAIPYENGYLVVSNHMSYFDIIILGSVVPGAFISKAAVRYWPVIGWGAIMIGTLFFDRKSKRSRAEIKQKAIERLNQGQNVVIFPEGTTSDGRTLLPFRYGAFDIAIKAGTTVVPVAINYASPETIRWKADVSFLRHIIGIGQKEKVDVRVHIDEAISPNAFKSSVDMSELAWRRINAMLTRFGMTSTARIADVNWNKFVLNRDATGEQLLGFMSEVLQLTAQVDSSTVVGERQVCEILEHILEVNGRDCEITVSPEGHSNLIASKGEPSIKQLNKQRSHVVLMSNSDVVPTDPEGWTYPPFSAQLVNNEVWGRGTLDMKGLMSVFLANFLLTPEKLPLHFLCLAGEERGGTVGARFITQTKLEELQAKVVLGSGGFGIHNLMGLDKPVFMVNTAEKGSVWIKLEVSMETSSHSASPPEEYALEVLLRAILRATKLESDLVILPATQAFLTSVAQQGGLVNRLAKQALQVPIIGNQLRKPIDSVPFLRAMFRNTVAVTQIGRAEAENILNRTAYAILDCRLLPKTSVDALIAKLTKCINDNRVKIIVTHQSSPNETPFNDDNFRKLRLAIEEECADAIVTPALMPRHSGFGFFRDQDIPCLGIFPGLFDQDALNLLHGIDERVELQQLSLAYRVVNNFLQRYD